MKPYKLLTIASKLDLAIFSMRSLSKSVHRYLIESSASLIITSSFLP